MASVIPVAKSLYLCDEILADPTRVKPHLIGVLNSVRVPTFPHTVDRLCVFAKLCDGFGDVRCVVRVVNTRDLTTHFETSERMLHFRDRRQTLYAIFRLEQLVWPETGEFVVELYCNGKFVDDATLTIFQ